MKKRKTTLLLPKDLLDRAKLKALQENSSLSSLVTKTLEEIVYGKVNTKATSEAMTKLGVFQIGVKNIYKKRSELYARHK